MQTLLNCYSAYAIKRIHHQEPPSRDILENVSAKGGDLLTRTIENFKPPQNRENAANGYDSEGSGDEEHKTPKEEKSEVDDPGSGGRVTRGRINIPLDYRSDFYNQQANHTYCVYIGLRQAPPQRQLFQPDISSSRQSRHTPNNAQSPQPLIATSNVGYTYSPSSNPNSNSFSIANYEPRPQVPLTLRPVLTPGNNPSLFKERVKKIREAHAIKLGKISPSYRGMMLPGSKSSGTFSNFKDNNLTWYVRSRI